MAQDRPNPVVKSQLAQPSDAPILQRLLPPDQRFVQLKCSSRTGPEEIDISGLKLSDFIDVKTIQGLMNEFFEIVHMTMVIVDLKGKVLAGVGWQTICIDFHRVNPTSCRNCIESDTQLTVGIHPGEHRLYKCKNNLWDVATPLMVGEQHVGNIFSGQFFFDDEPIDREYFLRQARHYGFGETEYMSALERVPRLSRTTVHRAMSFMTKLAHVLSEMGYSKLKMMQSMSQRQQAEEALIRSEKLAVVGQLAGGVAHDFNNILMVISSYSELLYQRCIDPRERAYVQQIIKAATRGGDLTAQLLAFSRKQIVAPRVLSLNNVVQEAMAMLPRVIGENIELESRMAPDLAHCRADPGQIQQVVMNLCLNARDAMPKGGHLLIETSNVASDHDLDAGRLDMIPGAYVMLAVTDTGVGMNPDTLAHIFEPFFTTKEHGKGTGLGLATVYGIVAQNKGYVAARSQLGTGTTFKVYLPSVTESEAVEPTNEDDIRPVCGRRTVLLVEDDKALRESSSEFLQTCGYSVLAADNATDALRQLSEFEGTVDVLLTDVIMPGMSGPELAKKVVELNPNTFVVYMSGYTETASLDGLDRGRAQYLQKPFPLRSLSRILASMDL